MTTTALTESDVARLETLEGVIQGGKQTFVDVGLALSEIRERRLYRRDYHTFEAYCQERWGWTRQRSAQLINAAVVVQALPESLSTMVDTERAAREVEKLPAEARGDTVKRAAKAGRVTAKAISEYGPPPEPKKALVDKIGRKIPPELADLWKDGEACQAHLTAISRLRTMVRDAQEANSPTFAEVNYTSVLAALDTAYSGLKVALPYVVCPTCQGKVSKTCRLCKGRGFISEFRWTRCVPKETKELVLKTIS